MKIVVAGGTGFLGTSLLSRLTELGHSVDALTRRPEVAKRFAHPNVTWHYWDGASPGGWANVIDGSEAVINLAGESIGGKRWTPNQKRQILKSRVNSTRALVDAIAKAQKKPRVLVNASAVGYYGNVESGEVTEDHPKGNDFLADVVDQWETEARRAEKLGMRVAMMRCGIVLEKEGGALRKFLLPFNLFVGGPLGSGRQWLPWIHRDDAIGAYLFAVENTQLSGPVNVVAPQSVTMKEFCAELGKAMRRPSWAPVPAFVLRIALGEMATMVLTGQKVVPEKLTAAGFSFKYPRLEDALASIFSRGD